jgi:hypothetical protein
MTIRRVHARPHFILYNAFIQLFFGTFKHLYLKFICLHNSIVFVEIKVSNSILDRIK